MKKKITFILGNIKFDKFNMDDIIKEICGVAYMQLKKLSTKDLKQIGNLNIVDIFEFTNKEWEIIFNTNLLTINDIIQKKYEELFLLLKRNDKSKNKVQSSLLYNSIVNFIHTLGLKFNGENEFYDSHRQLLSNGEIDLTDVLKLNSNEEKQIIKGNISMLSVTDNIQGDELYHLSKIVKRNSYTIDSIFGIGTTKKIEETIAKKREYMINQGTLPLGALSDSPLFRSIILKYFRHTKIKTIGDIVKISYDELINTYGMILGDISMLTELLSQCNYIVKNGKFVKINYNEHNQQAQIIKTETSQIVLEKENLLGKYRSLIKEKESLELREKQLDEEINNILKQLEFMAGEQNERTK